MKNAKAKANERREEAALVTLYSLVDHHHLPVAFERALSLRVTAAAAFTPQPYGSVASVGGCGGGGGASRATTVETEW